MRCFSNRENAIFLWMISEEYLDLPALSVLPDPELSSGAGRDLDGSDGGDVCVEGAGALDEGLGLDDAEDVVVPCKDIELSFAAGGSCRGVVNGL